MRPSLSRHTRLTSLVGTLLTISVAGCLVAFSMVAQHAAQQTPEAPEVRPVTPEAGTGSPLELGPVEIGSGREPEGAEPTTPAGSALDDLLAEGPDRFDTEVPTTDQDPRREPRQRRAQAPKPPVPPQQGPEEPKPCRGDACRPSRPEPTGGPDRPSPPDEGDGDHCGDGHQKGKGKGHDKGHGKGHGKGHCEHEGDDAEAEDDSGDGDHPGKGKGKGNSGSDGGDGNAAEDGPGKGKSDKGSEDHSEHDKDDDHPGKGQDKDKGGKKDD